jgi:hypothetical protein
MKILTIIVISFNNWTDYSTPSKKSEKIESGFGFKSLEGFKVLFKCVRYPLMFMFIDLKEFSINFFVIIVFSGTTDDPYHHDSKIILISGSLTNRINQINEIRNDIKEIISVIKEIIQNITNMSQTIKNLKYRLDSDEKKIEEQDDKKVE